jgi:mono/diheme cytochrome c family protein
MTKSVFPGTHMVISAATVVTVVASVALLAVLPACSPTPRANPADAKQVALGKTVYAAQCAACHGANLQGQSDWQVRKADKKLPAPPHDASGHTWHHDDDTLINITKFGFEKYTGPGYQTDMPKFAGVLSDDEVFAVLAYIKSTWPKEEAEHQASMNRK